MWKSPRAEQEKNITLQSFPTHLAFFFRLYVQNSNFSNSCLHYNTSGCWHWRLYWNTSGYRREVDCTATRRATDARSTALQHVGLQTRGRLHCNTSGCWLYVLSTATRPDADTASYPLQHVELLILGRIHCKTSGCWHRVVPTATRRAADSGSPPLPPNSYIGQSRWLLHKVLHYDID